MTEAARLLANRYQVGDLIGRGGMAEVHIGHDTRLGRTVAIKILRPDLARDPSFLTRFRREAQAAAGLNHPAIVAVYDTGEDSVLGPTGERQPLPFIVMEYVEGHTVRDILKGGAAAPIDEAVEIVAGVLSALDYSHAAGLVHRDIKPANVMLTPTGAVKVMDFGIARAMADVGQTMTQTQAVVGTAQYLSPEQARGETVDARSDLYSTGCLLFELLCGRPPFLGDSPVSVAYQHVREAAPTPSTFAPDVPPALDGIVLRALAKDRAQRYGSAAEFLADLNAFLTGRPVSPATGQFPVGSASSGAGATAVLAAAGANPGANRLGAPINPLDELVEVRGGIAARLRTVGIIVAALLAAFGIVLAALAMTRPSGEDPSNMVTVPILADMTQADATATLDNYGLEGTVSAVASDEVASGIVIRTDPPEGTLVAAGSTVILYVSVGPTVTTVPQVRGLPLAEALAELESAGLGVSEQRQVHGEWEVPAGSATATDPPFDATVAPGSEVILFVSSGKVDVLSQVGKTQAAAAAYFESIHITVAFKDVQTAEQPPGTIISQDPPPGLLAYGTTGVSLEVAIAVVMVAVPDVVGDAESVGLAALRSARFETTVVRDFSSTVPSGTIISTNPTAGTIVPEGTVVTVRVSKGPEPEPSPSP